MKSRTRDPRAVDFGLYAVFNAGTNEAVNPKLQGRWECSWTLDRVEEFLSGGDAVAPR